MTVQAQIAGVWAYVAGHGVELAMLAIVLVVLPLASAYVTLRAMVNVGDWMERRVLQWRRDRFERQGW